MKMNKKLVAIALCALPMAAVAQDAFDVLQNSQTELRGTSRFMSMAGAFGALGGDISALNQNPGGIGVYRSSDIGITFSLDINNSKQDGAADGVSQTKFNVNNVGYVGAARLNSEVMPNINWGFTYNRINSFNRHYRGGINDIQSSMSNFIADQVNQAGYTEDDLAYGDNYDPYFNSYAPWIGIAAYNAYAINGQNGQLVGIADGYSSGYSDFEVIEKGHTDEYSFNFGGNIKNVVYWGLGFGLTDLKYDSYNFYGENISNAYVYDAGNNALVNGTANYGVTNYLRTDGTGFNFKIGAIVKPVNELRFGLAFHTPTYYRLTDSYSVGVGATMTDDDGNVLTDEEAWSNDGYDYAIDYTIKTPWRLIGSVAGVLGQKGILSLDYEYVNNKSMRVGFDYDDYADVTDRVKTYFKPSHIIRLGGEYRVSPDWSLRAGYSIKTSEVEKDVDNGNVEITTVSTNPSYKYDNKVQYITAGVGYHHKQFYLDLAYVYKNRQSVYNAFSPIIDGSNYITNEAADIKDNNHRISCTLGFRF